MNIYLKKTILLFSLSFIFCAGNVIFSHGSQPGEEDDILFTVSPRSPVQDGNMFPAVSSLSVNSFEEGNEQPLTSRTVGAVIPIGDQNQHGHASQPLLGAGRLLPQDPYHLFGRRLLGGNEMAAICAGIGNLILFSMGEAYTDLAFWVFVGHVAVSAVTYGAQAALCVCCQRRHENTASCSTFGAIKTTLLALGATGQVGCDAYVFTKILPCLGEKRCDTYSFPIICGSVMGLCLFMAQQGYFWYLMTSR